MRTTLRIPAMLFAVLVTASACTSTPGPRDAAVVETALAPTPGVLVTGRLDGQDVRALRAVVRHVIDLTPDEETPGFDEAAAVRAQGIGYSNLPVRGATDLTPANVRAFDALLRNAPRPMLVHCASGNRVGAMAALRAAWRDGKPVEEAIAIGRAWGLTGLEDAVRARIASGPGASP